MPDISTSGLPAGCYWLHYLPGGTYYSAHQLAIRIDTSAPVITLSPASTYPGGVMSVSGAVEPGSPGVRILLKEGRKEVPIYSGSVNPWGQFTIDGVTIPANAPLGNTLEHIMPKDPENLVHTEEFKRDYLHNLGNLVLMTRGRNSSLKNKLPPEKAVELKRTSYLTQQAVVETILAEGWGNRRSRPAKRSLCVLL